MYQEVNIEGVLGQFQDRTIDFIPNNGNIGDIFIYASTLLLFDKFRIKTETKYGKSEDFGDVVLVGGGGNLIDNYDYLLPKLEAIHDKYKKVVILPHTIYGDNVKKVFSLFGDNVLIHVRERYSYDYLLSFYPHPQNIFLCYDLAFSYPIDKYSNKINNGILNAFRIDGERTEIQIPPDNIDLSDAIDLGKPYKHEFWELEYWPEYLERFLDYISQFRVVNTNRLHVAIAASIMGRNVNFFSNSYYKNQAVYEYSLVNFRNTNFFFSGFDYKQPLNNLKYLNDFPDCTSISHPKISIIIPCFNEGIMLLEAVDSARKVEEAEIIIVNDGSEDLNTIYVLEILENKGYQVINKENQGLSNARNAGISLSKAPYILPLDADNKVFYKYVDYGLEELKNNPDAVVVYSNPVLFDNYLDFRVVGDFDIYRLLSNNYIDACAIIRKDVIVNLGGYDEVMYKKIGYEDWELWLTIASAGYKFIYIPDFLFYYRVKQVSMSSKCSIPENRRALIKYLVNKHKNFYYEYIDVIIPEIQFLVSSMERDINKLHNDYGERLSLMKADYCRKEVAASNYINQLIEERDEWKTQLQITQKRKIYLVIKFLDRIKSWINGKKS